MEHWFNPVMLSRFQFAVTTLFHMLWPLLSIGLGVLLVVVEIAWLATGDRVWFHHWRFWGKLFLLSFGIGVASGLPLEFQFGTNWARFSRASGGFFGDILGYEGAMAFMLEAAFLGIALFAWNRVSRRMHLFATIMVAFGASLSAFWILDANSWMQTPTGVSLEEGKIVVRDYWAAIFNPYLLNSFTHMWVACLETTLFFVAGISAFCILRDKHREFFLKSFKVALVAAIVIAPLQIWLGDRSARNAGPHQPAKVAAMEAHWHTNPPGQSAAWALVAWPNAEGTGNAWEVRVPYLLSILETRSVNGRVVGLSAFPPEDRPPIAIPFYAFRLMVGIGFFMAALMLWGLWNWWRGKLRPATAGRQRWFWRGWVFAIPLGFLAADAGWMTREVGRQPWVIYNLMRTREGVSNLHAPTTATTLGIYLGIYVVLLILFIVFATRIIRKGPRLQEPAPTYGRKREGPANA